MYISYIDSWINLLEISSIPPLCLRYEKLAMLRPTINQFYPRNLTNLRWNLHLLLVFAITIGGFSLRGRWPVINRSTSLLLMLHSWRVEFRQQWGIFARLGFALDRFEPLLLAISTVFLQNFLYNVS